MSAKRAAATAYFGAMLFAMPALLLLIGAICSYLFGAERLHSLCVDGMLVGFAVGLLATAVRYTFATIWWVQERKGHLQNG